MVLELVAQSSTGMSMCMSPMISVHDCDAKPLSNVNDENLYEQDDSPLNVRPLKGCSGCSIQIAFAESLSIRLEIIRLINDLRFNTSYSECLRLGTELTELCHWKI